MDLARPTNRRPTIADIAKASGVSTAAVSFALNGKNGVSVETRERILEHAEKLGWYRSSAARALSEGHTGVIGLVVDRPAWVLGSEPFFMRLIAGMETRLGATGVSLLLAVTEDQRTEQETYRRWWGERRVDGVVLVDIRERDRRLRLLRELRLPAVALGHVRDIKGIPALWIDDGLAVRATVDHLATLGHRRIARVAGPLRFVHTRERTAAFLNAALDLGLPPIETAFTDYSAESGSRATRRFLNATDPPTALVFDNDVMAVAALDVARSAGLVVPDDLSIVAWDDSALCRLAHPSLTAVGRDVEDHGARAVTALLETIHGHRVADVRLDPPELLPRGSTGPRPGSAQPGIAPVAK